MPPRLATFLLISLGFHLAGLFLLQRDGHFQYGSTHGASAPGIASPALTVSIVAEHYAEIQTATVLPAPALAEPISPPITPIETELGNGTALPGASAKESDALEYLAAGQLTRLPVPITDVDLNVAAINDIAIDGEIKLTLFVNTDGEIDYVVSSLDKNEAARVFADRIKERFKNAHFTPGEINGKAVNSQIRITVISESLPGMERR
jgi:hypothetical protein